MNKLNLKRYHAVIWVMCLAGFCFTCVTASFSGVLNIKIFGRDLFGFADWLTSTYTAAIVSLTMSLFVGYKAMKSILHNICRGASVSNFFIHYL